MVGGPFLIIFAHSVAGHGWGGPIEPWEFQPTLVHFPIAFLLGVVLCFYELASGQNRRDKPGGSP